MFPDFFPLTQAAISHESCYRWETAGIAEGGEFLTLAFSESPNEGDGFSACSLAEVLEPHAAPKYSLSPMACRGILRRAERRGKKLPEHLLHALEPTALAPQRLETHGDKTP